MVFKFPYELKTNKDLLINQDENFVFYKILNDKNFDTCEFSFNIKFELVDILDNYSVYNIKFVNIVPKDNNTNNEQILEFLNDICDDFYCEYMNIKQFNEFLAYLDK